MIEITPAQCLKRHCLFECFDFAVCVCACVIRVVRVLQAVPCSAAVSLKFAPESPSPVAMASSRRSIVTAFVILALSGEYLLLRFTECKQGVT